RIFNSKSPFSFACITTCYTKNLEHNIGHFTVSASCFNNGIKRYNSRFNSFSRIYTYFRIYCRWNISSIDVFILRKTYGLQILRHYAYLVSLDVINEYFCLNDFLTRIITKIFRLKTWQEKISGITYRQILLAPLQLNVFRLCVYGNASQQSKNR